MRVFILVLFIWSLSSVAFGAGPYQNPAPRNPTNNNEPAPPPPVLDGVTPTMPAELVNFSTAQPVSPCAGQSGVHDANIDCRTHKQAHEECNAAHATALSACEPFGAADKSAAAVQTGASMGLQAMAAMNPLATCKAQEMQSLMAMGNVATLRNRCESAIQACWNSCNTTNFPENVTLDQDCGRLEETIKQKTIMGFGATALMLGQSFNCQSVLNAARTGVCAANNVQCLQYCGQNPQACGEQNCNAPGASKSFYCQMMSSGGQGFPNTPLPTDTGLAGNGEAGGGFSGYDAKGNGSKEFGSNDGGGGGGGALGAGAYPGGSGGSGLGGGGGGPGYNKDVDHGLSGGGGGGGAGIAIGMGSGGGYGGHGGNDNLDLSKFLPGGELDPARRGIASFDELRSKGITGANDLSNFEKITRMMNKKRAALMPGDGK